MRDLTASPAVPASDAESSDASPSPKRRRWWPLLVLAIAGGGFGSWLVFVWLGLRTRTRLWFVVAGVSAASVGLAFSLAAGTGPGSTSSDASGLVTVANWIAGVACVLVVRRQSLRVDKVDGHPLTGDASPPRRSALAWRPRQRSPYGVPTGPLKKPAKLWVAVLIAACVLALSIWGLVVFVNHEIRDLTLSHQGVALSAEVTGKDHEDDGDGTASDYLWVRIPACGCSVLVPTDNPGTHPVGSKIPVRYNPHDPTEAQALVDVPDAWFGDVTLFAFAAFCLYFAYQILQQARRGRRRPAPAVATIDTPQSPEASGMVVVGRLLSDGPASGRTRMGTRRRRGPPKTS